MSHVDSSPKPAPESSRCSQCGTILDARVVTVGVCGGCAFGSAIESNPPPSGNEFSLDKLNDRIRGIEIIEILGHGAMGVVYLGQRSHELVAVKVIRRGHLDNVEIQERFKREAKLLSELDHPGIVRLIEFHDDTEIAYIVMEFVDGITLTNKLASGALPSDQAERYLTNLLDAMASAHTSGVTHRDLKPANVLVVPDGSLKIVDFGLAKSAKSAHEMRSLLTSLDATVGTPRYMAPEQLEGGRVDARTDIFAIGCIAYEMFTGKVPTGKFPVPSKISSCPRRLDLPILTALESDPEQRHQNAAAFLRCISKSQAPTHTLRNLLIVAFAAIAGLLLYNYAWHPTERAPRLATAPRNFVDKLGLVVSPRQLQITEDADALTFHASGGDGQFGGFEDPKAYSVDDTTGVRFSWELEQLRAIRTNSNQMDYAVVATIAPAGLAVAEGKFPRINLLDIPMFSLKLYAKEKGARFLTLFVKNGSSEGVHAKGADGSPLGQIVLSDATENAAISFEIDAKGIVVQVAGELDSLTFTWDSLGIDPADSEGFGGGLRFYYFAVNVAQARGSHRLVRYEPLVIDQD